MTAGKSQAAFRRRRQLARNKRQEVESTPKSMGLRVGQTWKVHDVRKGKLTLKLTRIDDDWAEGEIVEGKVNYVSIDNRLNQKLLGMGTPGDTVTVRFSLCEFVEKVRAKKESKRA